MTTTHIRSPFYKLKRPSC